MNVPIALKTLIVSVWLTVKVPIMFDEFIEEGYQYTQTGDNECSSRLKTQLDRHRYSGSRVHTSSAPAIGTMLEKAFSLPTQNMTCMSEATLMSRVAPNMRMSILIKCVSLLARPSWPIYLITSAYHLEVTCDIANEEVWLQVLHLPEYQLKPHKD